jgi:hypothetical protein
MAMFIYIFCVYGSFENLLECWLVVICFSFFLLWKIFVFSSIVNDSFAGQSNLGLKLFSFIPQDTSLSALLAFKVSVDKSAVTPMSLSLQVI